MKKDQLALKGGVLIIGSLLWQDDGRKVGDNVRKNWRRDHLQMDKKVMVKAPIRYGRLSNGNPRVYTMAFSNACVRSKQGTGYFAPFINKLIDSWDALETEAKALSEAEGMHGNFLSVVSGTEDVWCVLGLLLNPERMPKKKAGKLIKKWGRWVETTGRKFDPADFRQGREKPCVDKNGLVNIPWPANVDSRDDGKLGEYDFIMVTAVKPAPSPYPTAGLLAKNIKSDANRYYFMENIKNGITTFQDNAVINLLK